jgi:hypothetical protein
LILRLPSGRTAIVAPDEEEFVPRHRNRVYNDRDQMFGPPPGFGPDYFPYDWNGVARVIPVRTEPAALEATSRQRFLSKKKLAMICDFRHTSRSCEDDQSS